MRYGVASCSCSRRPSLSSASRKRLPKLLHQLYRSSNSYQYWYCNIIIPLHVYRSLSFSYQVQCTWSMSRYMYCIQEQVRVTVVQNNAHFDLCLPTLVFIYENRQAAHIDTQQRKERLPVLRLRPPGARALDGRGLQRNPELLYMYCTVGTTVHSCSIRYTHKHCYMH